MNREAVSDAYSVTGRIEKGNHDRPQFARVSWEWPVMYISICHCCTIFTNDGEGPTTKPEGRLSIATSIGPKYRRMTIAGIIPLNNRNVRRIREIQPFLDMLTFHFNGTMWEEVRTKFLVERRTFRSYRNIATWNSKMRESFIMETAEPTAFCGTHACCSASVIGCNTPNNDRIAVTEEVIKIRRDISTLAIATTSSREIKDITRSRKVFSGRTCCTVINRVSTCRNQHSLNIPFCKIQKWHRVSPPCNDMEGLHEFNS